MCAFLCRGSPHLTSHSFVHWAVWLGTVAGCVFISFILAEGALGGRRSCWLV